VLIFTKLSISNNLKSKKISQNRMKRNYLSRLCLIAALFAPIAANAQVTIGAGTLPAATLDVVVADPDGTSAEGIIAPRLSGEELTERNGAYGEAQDGSIVYVTDAPTAVTLGKTETITAKGYYYFDYDAANSQDAGLWKAVGGNAENAAEECSGTVSVDFKSGSTAVNVPSAAGLLGGVAGAYEVVAIGESAAVNPELSVDALGIGLLSLGLEDLEAAQPFEANSDGYLSNISLTFDVTDSSVAASLNVINSVDFSLDAYLYEAVGNSGDFNLVAGTEMPVKDANISGITVLQPLFDEGQMQVTGNFAGESIKITAGNKYLLVVSLSSGGTLSLLANVEGNVSATMNVVCEDAANLEAMMTARNGVHIDTNYETGGLILGLGDNPIIEPTVLATTAGNALTLSGEGGVSISAPLTITSSTPSAGKVLTSDEDGNATWQDIKEPWPNTITEGIASSTDNVHQHGQVTIGGDQLVASAALDVEAGDGETKRGVLLPRVALTSSTDQETILNPATGLLIYNTGEDENFTTEGYLYWDGAQWKLFTSASSEQGRAELQCSGVVMSPGQQVTQNVAILKGTVLQIPYAASNGGSIKGIVLQSENNPNVTATLENGMLAVGNGVLTLSLQGMPVLDQQAPQGITFDLQPLYDANPDMLGCDQVTVGDVLTADIAQSAVMGSLSKVTDEDGSTVWALMANSPDGKFSFRVKLPGNLTGLIDGEQQLNVQVRNNSMNEVGVVWNYETIYGGSISTTGVLKMPSRIWGGSNAGGAPSTWWKQDANGVGGFWGDIGIYDGVGDGPEYRRYTWIPLGADNKVAYTALVMVAIDAEEPSIISSPDKVKAYIKFEQVTAM
jgi:hypothetical protein